jgi:hypothetical protein
MNATTSTTTVDLHAIDLERGGEDWRPVLRALEVEEYATRGIRASLAAVLAELL